MVNRGLSHVGLSTHDLERTLEFYEKILGFKRVRADITRIKEGGELRHVFLDTGQGQLLAFMAPRGIQGIPEDYDAGINRGLGVPDGFYHFAFEAGSEAELEKRRLDLLQKGVEVSEVVDHEGWCKSIYFKDPNNIQLEYCCMTRELTEDDARMQLRSEISAKGRL